MLSSLSFFFYSGPYELLSDVEASLKNALRNLHMDSTERNTKTQNDTERLQSLEKFVREHLSIERIQEKVEHLVKELAVELSSEPEKTKFIAKFKSHEPSRDQRHASVRLDYLQDTVKYQFLHAIAENKAFCEMCSWAETEKLLVNVKQSVVKLNIARAHITGADNFSGALTLLSDLDISRKGDSHAQESAVVAVHTSNTMTFPVKTNKQISSLDQQVQSMYEELLKMARENDDKLLKDVVNELLDSLSPPIGITRKELPRQINELRLQLESTKTQTLTKDHYKDLLRTCQKLKGIMSMLQLELKIHEYQATDIIWPEPKCEVATGYFSIVYKVSAETIQDQVALKIMKVPVTEDNSEQFMNELLSCK